MFATLPKMKYLQTYSFSVEVSCGGRTAENCTYLTQTPSATPATDSDDLNDQCSYTICPRTTTVNRIRLEFAVIIEYRIFAIIRHTYVYF